MHSLTHRTTPANSNLREYVTAHRIGALGGKGTWQFIYYAGAVQCRARLLGSRADKGRAVCCRRLLSRSRTPARGPRSLLKVSIRGDTMVGYTCSRLHLGGESARSCNQAARRWRLIIYLRMKPLGARPSYIDSDQNNKTFLSYPILSYPNKKLLSFIIIFYNFGGSPKLIRIISLITHHSCSAAEQFFRRVLQPLQHATAAPAHCCVILLRILEQVCYCDRHVTRAIAILPPEAHWRRAVLPQHTRGLLLRAPRFVIRGHLLNVATKRVGVATGT